MNRAIKVLIVDDNADVRNALKRIIETTVDIVVGGEAASGEEALSKIVEQQWDVVLLDVTLPDINGLEVLRRIKTQALAVRILMVSVHPEEHYAAPCLRNGALGYLTKDNSAEELAAAIRKVAAGKRYVSPRSNKGPLRAAKR